MSRSLLNLFCNVDWFHYVLKVSFVPSTTSQLYLVYDKNDTEGSGQSSKTFIPMLLPWSGTKIL